MMVTEDENGVETRAKPKSSFSTHLDMAKIQEKIEEAKMEQERLKEVALLPLYRQRQELTLKLENFWSSVFLRQPPHISHYFQRGDEALLAHLTSFHVERFEIANPGGDPRSLRFTFDFRPNNIIEDVQLVKELRYRERRTMGTAPACAGFVSDPVPIRWKSEKKDLTRGLGPLARSLFEAEIPVPRRLDDEIVNIVYRDGLWQNDRLLERLQAVKRVDDIGPGFFAWFYYRGIDLAAPEQTHWPEDGGTSEADSTEERDIGLRDVEIFPAGAHLAEALAEDLWKDAVVVFDVSPFRRKQRLPESESEAENLDLEVEDGNA